MKVRPIFIFSLPRSGSTFLQRLIAANDLVSTTSEPWLLLPFFYNRPNSGIYAEYNHNDYCEALNEFIRVLPRENNDYNEAIRRFAGYLYSSVSTNHAKYFLDKTPRYHLIANDIISAFPDGKFIFLWRNPLSTVSSIMETWRNGEWNLHRFHIDLYKGLSNLIDAWLSNKNKCISITYEELIRDTENSIELICDYLNLPFSSKILNEFTGVNLKGNFGDQVGLRKYNNVASDTLDKWKRTLNNPIRKKWVLNYINWIGEERLKIIGYDIHTIIDEVNDMSINMKHTISDILGIGKGLLYPWIEPDIYRSKIKDNRNRYLHF